MIRRDWAIALLFFMACGRPTPAPPPPDWIADAAGALTAREEAELRDLLIEFNERASVQMVGVTVPTLAGQPIASYAADLSAAWELGSPYVHDGVMILVATEERQMHIALGLGMRWTISESHSAEITASMTPHFGRDEYFLGFREGITQLIAANEETPWQVAYYTLEAVRAAPEQALRAIVNIECVITGLEDDAALIRSDDGVEARLLLPRGVGLLSVEDELLVYARVAETDPIALMLLGMEFTSPPPPASLF